MDKRLFDIIFSGVVLILLSPLFILISLLIKITSKGEVIFIQKRLGKNGRSFNILKFRTMVSGADTLGSHLTGKNDSRITSFGRILRKTKFDEFPQFINVLKGDMSIVGPRPEVEDFREFYTGKYSEILKIRPGITDFASIYYIEEENLFPKENREKYYIEKILPKKLEIQLEYVKNHNLFVDFKIILKTIKSIIIKTEKKSYIDDV